jgi:hypothetical protein
MTSNSPSDSMEDQAAQLRSQLDQVTDRLTARYADIPAEAVRSCVTAESERFSEARVQVFIPVLVERAARLRLDRR